MCDENGVYISFFTLINDLDPLIAKRYGNELSIILDDATASLFSDDNVNYIGEKMAAYIKIKEKEKEYYARN